MSQAVTYRVEDDLGWISIDNPPVNATSQAVREGLLQAIELAENDQTTACVLWCEGRSFIAGADIREFGKPPLPPSLPQVVQALEGMGKPIIAALHGNALGGGLEIAMACHYRLALADCRLGLPEINLGLIPGSGGIYRAACLMGADKALELVLSGKPIKAQQALDTGLIDRVCDNDLRVMASALAREVAGQAPRRSSDLEIDTGELDTQQLATMRARAQKKHKGTSAPDYVFDTLLVALDNNYADTQAFARPLFEELMASPEAKALRYAFFTERSAGASRPRACEDHLRSIERVAIIGAGTMGSGICTCISSAGIPVTLLETDRQAIDRGMQQVQHNLDGAVSRSRMTSGNAQQAMARITATTSYTELAKADLVIEAVYEDLNVKREVFAQLARVCKRGAILATNTSYQDVSAIAAATNRTADVLGLHFFSPAHVMKLLEVVRTRETSEEVLATAMNFARRIGKTAVVAENAYGFIGNRMLLAYNREAHNLILHGASPWRIDTLMEDWGMAMGPFAVGDLAGLDIGYRARKARLDGPDDPRYFRIADLLVEQGDLGRKSGTGFYCYGDDPRQRTPNPEVDKMTSREARRLRISQREIKDDEIVERLLLALANEGCRILDEGIAARASDIDMVYLNGYGFPRFRGGPMFHAEQRGLAQVLARIESFASQPADAHWQPAELLQVLQRDSGSLLDWRSAQESQS